MSQEYKASSFITKFHSMLKNKNFERVIKYDQKQSTITIFDKEKLQIDILPYFFRHNKFTSFIRQLNLYGFKKIKNSTVLSFTHPSLLCGKRFETIVAKKKLSQFELDEPYRNLIQQPQQNHQENNAIRSTEIGVQRSDRRENDQITYCPQPGYFFLQPNLGIYHNQPFIYPPLQPNWNLTYIVPMQSAQPHNTLMAGTIL